MKKILMISLMAGSITFALFAFMAFLISSDKVIIEIPKKYVPIHVASLPEERPPEVKPPVVLKPPVPAPPVHTIAELPTPGDGASSFEYDFPTITSPGEGVKGFTLGNNSNNDARPIVRVSPKYPLKAASKGIEGWVLLTFNINTIGEVVNVSILDSNPKRIFDKAARQALKKWKYRAKKVDGNFIEQQGLTVQLDFTMDQSS